MIVNQNGWSIDRNVGSLADGTNVQRFVESLKFRYVGHLDGHDTELMVRHLEELRAGRPVEVPVYDFARYARRPVTETARPRRAIIVEGILIYVDAKLRTLMDVKVFVDTDADTRFIRRLTRDGGGARPHHGVGDRPVAATVKPMHFEFVEPTKRYADLIIPQGGHNSVAIDMLLTLIRGLAADR